MLGGQNSNVMRAVRVVSSVRESTRLAKAGHVESKSATSTPCLTAVFSGYLGEKQNHHQPKGIT